MSSIDERVHVFESMSQELSNAPETSLSQSAGRKPPQTITPLQPQQQPQPTAYQDPAIQEVVEAVPTTKTTTVIQGSDNRPPQLEDNYSPLAVTPLTISDSPYTNTTSGQEQPRKHQQGRKQSATNAIVSVQQAIRDVSDTELSHPRKRPKTLKPSIPGLVKDLTGPLGIERFKSHLIDYLRTPKDRLLPWISFTSLAHNESDSVEKILKCFELYEKLQNGTAFGKLLSLISRIEILDMIEGKTLEDPRQVWVPKKIPKDVCEQIISGLQPKTNITFHPWVSISRKYRILRDWLPFMAKPSSVEKLQFKELEELCKELNSCNQGLAKLGQSFRRCILKQQSCLWESIKLEDLSTIPDNTLFNTITICQSARDEATSQSQSSTGHKVEQYYCGFCRTSGCIYTRHAQALTELAELAIAPVMMHATVQR